MHKLVPIVWMVVLLLGRFHSFSTSPSTNIPLKPAETTVVVSKQYRHLFAEYTGNISTELQVQIKTSRQYFFHTETKSYPEYVFAHERTAIQGL